MSDLSPQQDILYTVLAQNKEKYEAVKSALKEQQVEIYLENPDRHRISVLNMSQDTQASMIALGTEIYRNIQYDIDLKSSEGPATPDRPSVVCNKNPAAPISSPPQI